MQIDNINKFHSISPRHVLTVEADNLTADQKECIFQCAQRLCKASNQLTHIMSKRLYELQQNRKYIDLKKQYGILMRKHGTNKKKSKKLKLIADQLNKYIDDYGLTYEHCYKLMQTISKYYRVNSVLALSKADDVYTGVEKVLYDKGKHLHYIDMHKPITMRGKQFWGAIIIGLSNNHIAFKFNKIKFTCKYNANDLFMNDELNNIKAYLSNLDNNHRNVSIDNATIDYYNQTGKCLDTFRPCYCLIKCEKIRGKKRIFIQITIEGKPLPKFSKDGKLRHKLGKGKVGCDIGTQTFAYSSDTEVGLKNLAERGKSIKEREKKLIRVNRKLDRSRRSTNPDNFNADGTCKHEKLKWNYSNNYKKLIQEFRELHRIAALNRKYAIQEDVNHLRELGDVFITEPKNAARLSRKANSDSSNPTKKRKRFGKSIQNRCPGYFQALCQSKFNDYHEVPNNYRASQYDHTDQQYKPKDLSVRLYNLSDGSLVQRDWYSSFLLYCCNNSFTQIDQFQCDAHFNINHNLQLRLINQIKAKKLHIKNSGINV